MKNVLLVILVVVVIGISFPPLLILPALAGLLYFADKLSRR